MFLAPAGHQAQPVQDTTQMHTTHLKDEFAKNWAAAQPMVGAYISSVVRDYHDAEDLLQQVAVIAFRKREDYQPGTAFVSWVCSIARYELLRWQRDKARNRLVFSDKTVEILAEVQDVFETELDDRQEALQHCFGVLDRKAVGLLKLRYKDNLTPEQIARQTKMKPVSVRVALHRIRQLLEKCITDRMTRGVEVD